MYIKSLEIKNIRAIKSFKMSFEKPAGWHVLIGDNGAGKSSLVRSIAIGLLGEDDTKALSFSEDFANWLSPKEDKGTILINAIRDNNFDMPAYKSSDKVKSEIIIERVNGNGKVVIKGKVTPQTALWGQYSSSNGWFIAAYGPFRRLRGNSETVVSSRPRLGACITAFRDDVALTQLTEWLKNLALDSKKKPKAKKNLQGIIKFINSTKLLPGNARLTDDIDSDGIKLVDGNNVNVALQEMSDGFRSILSMVLDIIRYMIDVYGSDKVFKSTNAEQSTIDLPGVILIDEVDAHLHPTWQTRIGKWFTDFFPNIQFIVTTHSPLVCRACDNGSVWRLSAPGLDGESGQITGLQKDRLIFGNILDAYGTEIFGRSAVRSAKSNELLNRLGKLNMLSAFGKITAGEEKERIKLQKTLSTDAPIK
jgi:energy-coupling factor transporter ATP-binding protein EcfA2